MSTLGYRKARCQHSDPACDTCQANRERSRAWYNANPQKAKERRRAYPVIAKKAGVTKYAAQHPQTEAGDPYYPTGAW